MLLTLALIILGASIVVFFSEEFAGIIKSLYEIFWIRLLLPIFIASMLLEYYDRWALWLAIRLKEYALTAVDYLNYILPTFLQGTGSGQVIFLFLIAFIPLWIMHILARRKLVPMSLEPAYLASFLLWVMFALLLIGP